MKSFWYTRPDWSDHHGNIGDIIWPKIVEWVTGARPEFTTAPGKVLGCGSIAESVQDNDILCGCGLIQEMTLPFRQGVKALMVRGPMTQRAMPWADFSDCIFADPCFLLPLMYPRGRTHEFKVGIIPHYIEVNEAREVFPLSDWKHIDIISDVETFVTELNRCDTIVSSSLHGIAIAEAYGIHVIRMRSLSGKIIGGDFKFDDYRMGINRIGGGTFEAPKQLPYQGNPRALAQMIEWVSKPPQIDTNLIINQIKKAFNY